LPVSSSCHAKEYATGTRQSSHLGQTIAIVRVKRDATNVIFLQRGKASDVRAAQ